MTHHQVQIFTANINESTAVSQVLIGKKIMPY